MSYLPLKQNMGSLTGDIYVRPLTAARPYSAGFADTFTFSPTVEQDPIYGVVDGIKTKVGTRLREKGASVSMVMRELRADWVSAAVQGTLQSLTQAAVTGGTITATDVDAGELIDTGVLDISNVVLNDGTDDLRPGQDYTVYGASGTILVRRDVADLTVTYDAAAIDASAGRKAIAILNSAEGLRCEIIVIGRNPDGKRYKVVGLYVALKPSGDVTLAGDGSDLTNIELEGEVEIGPDPEAPYGYIAELA